MKIEREKGRRRRTHVDDDVPGEDGRELIRATSSGVDDDGGEETEGVGDATRTMGERGRERSERKENAQVVDEPAKRDADKGLPVALHDELVRDVLLDRRVLVTVGYEEERPVSRRCWRE